MSMTVTDNHDGTWTVTCGSESATIGNAASPQPMIPPDPPMIWFPGGPIAHLTRHVHVVRTLGSPSDVSTHLRAALRSPSRLMDIEHEAYVLRYSWKGNEALDISELWRELRASEASDVRIELYSVLTDPSRR